MKKLPIKESDLALVFMKALESQGWNCYPEVVLSYGIADILAIKNNVTWVIETKTSATLVVMQQAYRWVGIVNMVSVGISKGAKYFCFEAALRKFGIGLMLPPDTRMWDRDRQGFREIVKPQFNRNTVYSSARIKSKLYEEMKDYLPGGTSSDKRFSPWRHTINQAVEYIKEHPHCRIKDIVPNIRHQYRTNTDAKNSLRTWLQQGDAGKLVECELVNGSLQFKYKEINYE